MFEHLCDICKKEPAQIKIIGRGHYCLKCHNETILREFGIDNTFDYAETIVVMEPDGVMHTFKVEHVILGSIVSWDAYEQGGNYHFREISDIDANGTGSAQKFFQKIVEGVCTKSLNEHSFDTSNLAYQDEKCFSLRNKGTINIVQDEDRGFEIGFEIDGKRFRGKDLEKLLGVYPGFSLQYQIHDASEPILKEDEYLVPVRITKQSLIEELEDVINIYSDSGFISYKDTLVFDDAFYKITDKLEVLVHSEKKEDAIAAGREMVRRMAHVETDDDYFLVNNIELICRIIDPFGIDAELKEIVQEWKDSF